jgi:hypothetical protein
MIDGINRGVRNNWRESQNVHGYKEAVVFHKILHTTYSRNKWVKNVRAIVICGFLMKYTTYEKKFAKNI